MKTLLSQSLAEAVEADPSSSYPEIMVSIATGDGANPITDVSAKMLGSDVEGGSGSATVDGLLNPKGGLISVLKFSGGVPVADIVDTAHITADGVLDPGVDVGGDVLLIIWQISAGDPCVSRVR
jgi:hypothetical protein